MSNDNAQVAEKLGAMNAHIKNLGRNMDEMREDVKEVKASAATKADMEAMMDQHSSTCPGKNAAQKSTFDRNLDRLYKLLVIGGFVGGIIWGQINGWFDRKIEQAVQADQGHSALVQQQEQADG